MSRRQLRELGFSDEAIDHRVETGRLHVVRKGVYAVGRRDLSPLGRLMAAVLACGDGAVVSHQSAAELWGVRTTGNKRVIHVSVPASRAPRHPGVLVHRRSDLAPGEITKHDGIPVTAIATTLLDLATVLTPNQLEAAVIEADKRDLIDPEALRTQLEAMPRRRGKRILRELLDSRTFALTESELERRFLVIARSAGLPKPETQAVVNGLRVDFYWRDLKLVVETDGLRYHRTAAQQTKDRLRDQRHAAAGVTPLRFTHRQVAHDQAHVRATLLAVVKRLRTDPSA